MQAGLIWLIGALVLAAGESLGGELFLLMLAGGALGGGLAAVVGAPVLVQGLAFALVSLLLVIGVRPLMRRRLNASTPELDTNTAALTGRSATITSAIETGTGLVEIGGDTWTARPLVPGETFTVGESVLVHEIEGATAVVIKGV